MNKHNPRYPARCPCCGHHLWPNRFGRPMSPLKAAIIDALVAAGPEGMHSELLIERIGHPMSLNTLKTHVSQINDHLLDSGQRIISRALQKYLVQE